LADIEPPDGSHDSEPGGGIGIGSFLSSAPRAIGSITALIGAVTGLLIALNKVGVLGGDKAGGGATTTETYGSGLFTPLTRTTGSRVYFDGKTMYVKAATPTRPLLVLANQDKPLEDVAMSFRVEQVGGASDYGMALICRYDSNRNYYFLSVLSGGRYNIARYRDGKLKSLAHGTSSALTEGANDITAKCVGDQPTSLRLEANGRTVGTAKDADGLAGGNIGIRVGTNESFVTVRFEDFILRSL
jgi:hypothetical protein